MDLGCTFPSDRHIHAFLSTCKQLRLHTVAFRGLVVPAALQSLEKVSRSEHGHNIKCLRRADFRLSGSDCLASLAKRLTASEMFSKGSSNATAAGSSSARQAQSDYYLFEDADLLVLHLDSHSDTSILGDPKFGELLIASQRAVAARRGPNARLIVINLDCFVTASPSKRLSSSPSYSSTLPAPASTFALCKALAKCNDVVFELSYLPWVRAHSRGGGAVCAGTEGQTGISSPSLVCNSELFTVPFDIYEAYQSAMEGYENALARMAERGSLNPTRNTKNDNNNTTIEAVPVPPMPPMPMIHSIRKVSQEIVAAFSKPLLLSSGQIVASNPRDEADDPSSSSSQSVSTDLLFFRSSQDIHALASTLTQLRRPLLEQGLAVARRLAKLKDNNNFNNFNNYNDVPSLAASARDDDRSSSKHSAPLPEVGERKTKSGTPFLGQQTSGGEEGRRGENIQKDCRGKALKRERADDL